MECAKLAEGKTDHVRLMEYIGVTAIDEKRREGTMKSSLKDKTITNAYKN